MIFGSNALITKPAISFSPMITLYILESAGYDQVTEKDAVVLPSDREHLHATMFSVMWMVPVITATLQIIIWSFYRIRNSHKIVAIHIEI